MNQNHLVLIKLVKPVEVSQCVTFFQIVIGNCYIARVILNFALTFYSPAMENSTFIWFIENFSYCWHKNDEPLDSPMFTASNLENTKWNLRLYPRGVIEDEEKGWISIYLSRNNDGGPDSLTVDFETAFVTADGTSDRRSTHTIEFFHDGFNYGGSFKNLSKDFYMPRDILTVRCRLWKGEEIAETVPTIFARTRIGIDHISFVSTIENFSGLNPNQRRRFHFHPPNKKGGVTSCIQISDGSCCEKKVMVEITPSNNGEILAKCELSLIKEGGHRVKCAKADNRFDAMRKEIGKLSLSLTKDAIMQQRSEYLPDDRLSLLCECVFSTGIEFEKIEGTSCVISGIQFNNVPAQKLRSCSSALHYDLERIYSTKHFTDVELETKTNSFSAHKIVLCARSPVFKSMMSHDTQERKSGIIHVDDLEDDTVEKLLSFLYTDNVEDLQWESAINLYSAADKYQIEKLRLICSVYLIDNVTISTATELLILADTHSDFDTKDAVEKFILEHDKEVFTSNDWHDLVHMNPSFALKTMDLKYKEEDHE